MDGHRRVAPPSCGHSEQDTRKIGGNKCGVRGLTVPGKVWRPDKGVGIYPS